jgi:N-acetylmuramic acid 6-phosphate etherase
MVLNMISTGVMVRRGAVSGNLMVNVQPTNAKLVDRARRIIASATGCDPETAAALLNQTGSVRAAIEEAKSRSLRDDNNLSSCGDLPLD